MGKEIKEIEKERKDEINEIRKRKE